MRAHGGATCANSYRRSLTSAVAAAAAAAAARAFMHHYECTQTPLLTRVRCYTLNVLTYTFVRVCILVYFRIVGGHRKKIKNNKKKKIEIIYDKTVRYVRLGRWLTAVTSPLGTPVKLGGDRGPIPKLPEYEIRFAICAF